MQIFIQIYHHDEKDSQEVDEKEDLADAEEGPGDGDGQDGGPDGGHWAPQQPHCYQQTLIKFEFISLVGDKSLKKTKLRQVMIIAFQLG